MKDFVQKVERMRKLQKQYFRGRSKQVLAQSKEAERAVDEALEQMGHLVRYVLPGRN